MTAPDLTREEFITAYAERSEMPEGRTDNGFTAPGAPPMVALPCRCGEEDCDGWAMVYPRQVKQHMAQNGISPASNEGAEP